MVHSGAPSLSCGFYGRLPDEKDLSWKWVVPVFVDKHVDNNRLGNSIFLDQVAFMCTDPLLLSSMQESDGSSKQLNACI